MVVNYRQIYGSSTNPYIMRLGLSNVFHPFLALNQKGLDSFYPLLLSLAGGNVETALKTNCFGRERDKSCLSLCCKTVTTWNITLFIKDSLHQRAYLSRGIGPSVSPEPVPVHSSRRSSFQGGCGLRRWLCQSWEGHCESSQGLYQQSDPGKQKTAVLNEHVAGNRYTNATYKKDRT